MNKHGSIWKDKAINHVIKAKRAREKLDEAFKEKGVWIVAKKLHPYPLNLKYKVWNQGEEDGGYEHYPVFLVKRRNQETLMCFYVFFCDWKRGEKLKLLPAESRHPGKSLLFWFGGAWGLL